MRLARASADGMLGGMRRLGVAAVSAVVAFACGGQAGADVTRRGREIPVPRDTGPPDAGAAPPSLSPPPDPRNQPPDEPAPFEDPGCPPVSPPSVSSECDPMASTASCPAGQSCFPFVRYPTGPCEVEQYGTTCLPAGPGTQGESCERQACAAEHICISTGRGTQCARLCSFADGAPNVCAPGLLCLPIDIEGFGGCL